MKKFFLSIIFCLIALTVGAQKATSPDGNLSVKLTGKTMVVNYNKKKVLELADIQFGKLTFARKVTSDYQMLAGKRLHCTNEANEYQTAIGDDARLVLRLYNDGIAFRYEYANLQNQKPPQEHTVYLIPEGTKRWMMQWAESYEGFFPLSTTCKQKPVPSFSGTFASAEGWNNRWAYPALLEPVKGVFALISEANIERRQSASCLYNDGERFKVVPAENNLELNGEWHTPWRTVIIGSLADIVQSTLVTDVSKPCQLQDTSWIHPGLVSWIYWAYNHGSNDYNIIRKYVDMAVTLHLPYVLIDAEWDEMDKLAPNEGKTIEDAVAYALSKGIKPLIWYNSSVGWIDGAPGPKFRLNKPEDREREFAWCEKIGVAGVKIDFFSGDNQRNMDYCMDLLECAARHHLLVNFHGAPIPRGWQRTYPNLLSTEGVYGAEWYNNVATFTEKAACHNATLPFTRNVIGPMDYTPCAFSDSQHPHITTHAHELALTVLFESGLQHLADRPESFYAQLPAVQDFLGQLPAVWDETRFVSGYPGEYVVLARRSGKTWYVAGINGTEEGLTLSLPLDFLPRGSVRLFTDGTDNPWHIADSESVPQGITLQRRGGFVMVIGSEGLNGILPRALPMTGTITGQNRNAPVNYDEDKVPLFEVPDLLKCEDGECIETARQWEKKRRPELLKMFSEHEYGVTPQHTGIKVKHELVASNPKSMGGLATQKQVLFTFTGKDGKSHQALLLLYLPNGVKGRVPVIVSYNFHGNQTTTLEEDVIVSPSKELMKREGSEKWVRGEQASRWSYELALQHGYAVATMNYHDIYPDSPDLRGYGIAPLMPGYKEDSREGNEWGAIGIWAWGYSRIADYLEKEKLIDPKRMVVLGHSRLGKTALWAGVQDKRFKVVISNDSGCGGAALSKRVFGENIARITSNFPHWFCPNFNLYSENEAALPFDQHELLALVAPRHVYVASAEDDQWADPKGEYLSAYYAGAAWQLYGMQGLPSHTQPAVHQPQHFDVGYHIRTGKHDVTEYDWKCYLAFCDKVLPKKTP